MDKRSKAEAGLKNANKDSSKPKKGGEGFFLGEGASGIKLSPKTVLILSLLFIASVVILHFFDKLKL